MKKRLFLVLLALCLVMTAFPVQAASNIRWRGYDPYEDYLYVEYGYYPYYSDGTPAPILWRVLDVRQNTALLQSVYALDAYYGNKYMDPALISSAFSTFYMYNTQMERMMLLADGTLSGGDLHNETFGFSALSGNHLSRSVKPTPYASSMGVPMEDGYIAYWTYDDGEACRVTPAGSVLPVNYAMTLAVVPTITVDVRDLTFDRGSGTFDDPFADSSNEISMWLWLNMFFDVENAPTATLDNHERETLRTYSGPGVHYYRDSNSAIGSRRLLIKLLAREGNWVMIEYQTNTNNQRLYKTAWIFEADLGSKSTMKKSIALANVLPEFNLSAKMNEQANLFDDFSMLRPPLYTLWQNQEVEFLGYTCINSLALAYIETKIYGKPVRGFVPLESVTLDEYEIDLLLNVIGE